MAGVRRPDQVIGAFSGQLQNRAPSADNFDGASWAEMPSLARLFSPLSPPARGLCPARLELPHHLMKALALTHRLVLAAAAAVMVAGAFSAVSDASINVSSAGDTPLPAGWELCI